MKSVRFVGLFAILISMLVLAQSNRAPLANQLNGLPIAQQPHPRVLPNFSRLPQGAPFARRGASAPRPNGTRRRASTTSGLNFANAVAYGTGGYQSTSDAVADVNGDGKPDIVVANHSGTVGVLLGNGDGTFQTAVAYDPGGGYTNSVAVADVNGDGKPDIVVANCTSGGGDCGNDQSDGTVGVLLGNGDGTFQTAVSYDSGGLKTFAVAVADVNGDGKPDIVVSNIWSNNVGVLLSNGDGTFQTVVTYGSGGYDSWGSGQLVAVADVNGDGKPDIVVANNCADSACDNGGSVGVLLGNGDGTFQPAVAFGSGGNGPAAVAVADVNGDGKPDLVVTNNNTGTVAVLLGNGDGTFQTATTYDSGYGGAPLGVAVADVDGDGKLDIVVADSGWGGLLGVLLGNGDGTFQTALSYGSGGYCTDGVVVTDVSGDGKPDILVMNVCNNSSVGVLINTSLTPTTTALTSSLNPSNFGQPVTFTATVTAQRGFYKGTPTGTVSFYDGTTLLGTGTLSNGVATYTTSSLSVGTHSMTAVYGGDTNFLGSTSGVLKQVVNQNSTTTGLTSSLNPSNYGQAVTFTATVTGQYGGTPTGTVSFYDGTTFLGTGTLSNGVATYTTSSLSVGSHSMTAVYGGDTNFVGSTSPVLKQVVNQASTTTGLTSSPNPSNYRQKVTLTSTVTGQYGGTPTGTVSFYDGTTLLGTGTLNNGVATYRTSALSVGSHSMTAVYGGDSNFYGSTSPVLKQVVNKTATTTTLTSSKNPSKYGEMVTFTATVTGHGGTPTGTVTFKSGKIVLAKVSLTNGVAEYSTKKLRKGKHTIQADYSGDADYKSSSASLVQTVN